MNLGNITVLNLLLFSVILMTYTMIGDVLVYIPIAMILLVKSYQVMVAKPTFTKASGLFKSINIFLLVAFFERVMMVNGMTILSYYTAFYLICAASYLVIKIDIILSNRVNDESVISIITSCFYLFFLCCYPQNVLSLSFTIWLVIAVCIYFTLTNQLLREVSLTSSQIMIIEQSQWLLFIYSLFRLISNILEVNLQMSLAFYIGALVLFLVIAFSFMKQYKQLKTSLRVVSFSTCILITALGVEYCYYVVRYNH